jgi:DNA repair exonuclease SbcCD nuclease subunit
MKFAHLGDCHLGGWRFPELQELSIQSFRKALDISIKEQVDIVLIAGDLFDSPYPSIDILKQTFKEFKKLYDAKIPCFIIAGSHDYSVSGKTFLDVLEHAGFCKNVFQCEEKDEKIILQPTIHENYAIYGFPGKKSSLEISELKKIQLQDTPGFFKILMLHTALTEAIGTLPINSISINELPKSDYIALSHLHIDFTEKNAAYSGPLFPNNFEELEELKSGQFYIIEVGDFIKKEKIKLNLKEIISIEIEIENTLTATDKIIEELKKKNLEDKIVLLKLHGNLKTGKPSDIRFQEIENFLKEQKPYVFIKSTSKLISEEATQTNFEDTHLVEEDLIEKYLENENSKFKDLTHPLLKSLASEKQEDETNQVFSDRLMSELNNILNLK